MPKEISTIIDFAGLDPGQVVILDGKETVFVGNLLVKTCNCCTVPNCFRFPHIVRVKANGSDEEIELVEIRLLEKSQPGRFTGMSIIHTIDKNQPEYRIFKDLLVAVGMVSE